MTVIVLSIVSVAGDGVYMCVVLLVLTVAVDELYDLNSSLWDIHVITSALKLFFRELPEPVVSHELCDMFLQANGKRLSLSHGPVYKCLVENIVKLQCLELMLLTG